MSRLNISKIVWVSKIPAAFIVVGSVSNATRNDYD
jgi:hypothetical protein